MLHPVERLEQLNDGDSIIALRSKQHQNCYKLQNDNFADNIRLKIAKGIEGSIKEGLVADYKQSCKDTQEFDVDKLLLSQIYGSQNDDVKQESIKTADELIIQSRGNLYKKSNNIKLESIKKSEYNYSSSSDCQNTHGDSNLEKYANLDCDNQAGSSYLSGDFQTQRYTKEDYLNYDKQDTHYSSQYVDNTISMSQFNPKEGRPLGESNMLSNRNHIDQSNEVNQNTIDHEALSANQLENPNEEGNMQTFMSLPEISFSSTTDSNELQSERNIK